MFMAVHGVGACNAKGVCPCSELPNKGTHGFIGLMRGGKTLVSENPVIRCYAQN